MIQGNLIELTELEVLEGFRLLVRFEDGVENIVYVSPNGRGPVFEPLRDPAYFARARIDPESKDTVIWPNGADISPERLRAGHPLYRTQPKAVSELGQRS